MHFPVVINVSCDSNRFGRTMVMHQCYSVPEKQCEYPLQQRQIDGLDGTAISIATHLQHWPTADNCDNDPMLSMCIFQLRSMSAVIPTNLVGRWSFVGATQSPRSNVSTHCSARSMVWTEQRSPSRPVYHIG